MFNDSTMMIYGGFSQKCEDYCDDMWSFDLRDNTWMEIYEIGYFEDETNSEAGPSPGKRWKFSVVYNGDTMFFFGGFRLWHGFAITNSYENDWSDLTYEDEWGKSYPKGGYLNDFWSYTKRILAMKPTPEQVPTESFQYGFWNKFTNRSECYDAPGDDWLERFDKACTYTWPQSRAGHTASYDWMRNLMWVYGGFRSYYPYIKTGDAGLDAGATSKTTDIDSFSPYPAYPLYLDDLWYYNFSDGRWTNIVYLSETNPLPRVDHIMALSGNMLITFGGYRHNFHNGETWLFNISSNRWRLRKNFVHPQWPEECTDDWIQIWDKSQGCFELEERKALERYGHTPNTEYAYMGTDNSHSLRGNRGLPTKTVYEYELNPTAKSSGGEDDDGEGSEGRGLIRNAIKRPQDQPYYFPVYWGGNGWEATLNKKSGGTLPNSAKNGPKKQKSGRMGRWYYGIVDKPNPSWSLDELADYYQENYPIETRTGTSDTVPKKKRFTFQGVERAAKLADNWSPIVPYAATAPRQYVRLVNETHITDNMKVPNGTNNTRTVFASYGMNGTIYERCTTVYASPSRELNRAFDGVNGRADYEVQIALPRRRAPGWDGCRDRGDGNSELPAELTFIQPTQRSNHKAIYIDLLPIHWPNEPHASGGKRGEIYIYGGLGHDQVFAETTSVTNPTDVKNDFWRYGVHECLNNCSNHGVCDYGFCECYDGYYGADCSNVSCPGDFCYYDEYSKEQHCIHCCSAGFNWTDHSIWNDGVDNEGYGGYKIPARKSPCNHNDFGQSNGICDGYGTCQCAAPFLDDDCSIMDCPHNCSFNGFCSVEYPISRCMCHEGYYGEYCQHTICLNNCSYPNGECDSSTGECSCYGLRNPYDSSQPFKIYRTPEARKRNPSFLTYIKWDGEDCSYLMPYAAGSSCRPGLWGLAWLTLVVGELIFRHLETI